MGDAIVLGAPDVWKLPNYPPVEGFERARQSSIRAWLGSTLPGKTLQAARSHVAWPSNAEFLDPKTVNLSVMVDVGIYIYII